MLLRRQTTLLLILFLVLLFRSTSCRPDFFPKEELPSEEDTQNTTQESEEEEEDGASSTAPDLAIDPKILSSGARPTVAYPSLNPYEPPGSVHYQRPRPGGGGADQSGSHSNIQNGVQNHPSISSVDTQLLAAMETLVQRMHKLDSRVTTLENVVHFLTQKQNSKPKPERGSCPQNFTRIDGIKTKCFHISSLYNAKQVHDWKSAATECAKLNARLVEIVTFDDYLRVTQFLVKYGMAEQRNTPATDFWTGGLNPGLLWIWSESGQQVEVDKRFWNDNNSGSKVPGCLKMSYSLRLNSFFFKGAPCSQPQNFVCEILNNNVARVLANFEEALVDTNSVEEEEH